jgi:hypothetical protein
MPKMPEEKRLFSTGRGCRTVWVIDDSLRPVRELQLACREPEFRGG